MITRVSKAFFSLSISISLVSLVDVLYPPKHFNFVDFQQISQQFFNTLVKFQIFSKTHLQISSMASYWCYRCTRFIRVPTEHNVICPFCDGGFIEAVDSTAPPDSPLRFPSPAAAGRSSNLRFRHGRRNQGGERSSFNPVIVLRGPADGGGGERSFELYYDDGAGSGLRPLPAAMSEFLMGSGFDRLLEQLAQIEINGLGRQEQPPASKVAIESMPTIEIEDSHIYSESHCAVCKEAFVMGSEAREMPCNHIYHADCILPWLSLRNSCPVCRHELPTDSGSVSELENESQPSADGEAAVGLTIWRLPGGGFAVGRFTEGGRTGERELPVVYTEMDGGFSNNGAPRRILWTSRRERSREGNGFGRVFRNLFSFLGRIRLSRSNGPESRRSISSRNGQSVSIFTRHMRRMNRAWFLEDRDGMARS
ncbi:E3 ubiquitin-protein ligase RDUF1-like [Impatiens glandulifera]|uniref:E3 ubiquitin-protein ligase RDUF1-like n=1 Tax=Impatiens glandulifera TaxID=253017 RepID=UPI001FB0CC64|nr:E3 ubiquitin-protein ligase RDUF1-like [Impatiens glandulifera]